MAEGGGIEATKATERSDELRGGSLSRLQAAEVRAETREPLQAAGSRGEVHLSSTLLHTIVHCIATECLDSQLLDAIRL